MLAENPPSPIPSTERLFRFSVLGRTLEHLGSQMYKRRDAALAELISNSWDAGANVVHVQIPTVENYNQATATITIDDDGIGMSADQVELNYLPVGRNRRKADGDEHKGRKVMGRKGIGKLAGFGMAREITIATWRDGVCTELTLDIDRLTQDDDSAKNLSLTGRVTKAQGLPTPSGTRITLSRLKHAGEIDIDRLHAYLSRRFSRIVQGEMKIYVNKERLREPELDFIARTPDVDFKTDTLSDGSVLRYFYGFTNDTIKETLLRGFAVYVRGKIAQAPPFYFNVEGTASGQHSTKYISGEIHADFLDEGIDDNDLVSTDRQELDWENPKLLLLHEWGDRLSRRALTERSKLNADKTEALVMSDPSIQARVQRLDKPSQMQVSRFLRQLGSADADNHRVMELANTIVSAFEYRHFHDVIDQIESASTDPIELERLLLHLGEWKVLESRAILEIIKGRLDIIAKFHEMVVNDSPETASKNSLDNMHDLLAGYPWLLNPEWQILSEEKSISKQLREWGHEELAEEGDGNKRYDFLALTGPNKLVVIEIKRADYAVTLEELDRLNYYAERLRSAHQDISMVFIGGGKYNISRHEMEQRRLRTDLELLEWADIYQRTNSYYNHYKAVLEGDIDNDDFTRKAKEVAKTRDVVQSGTVHRGSHARKAGIGVQDVDYTRAADSPGTGAPPAPTHDAHNSD